MINKKIIIAIVGIVALGFAIVAFKPGNSKIDVKHKIKGVSSGPSFAVVELFTSEGCSSCPPADQLLGNIIKKARKNDKRVFGLAFHVDYWDNLGWKDIYSSADYTQRQRKYAQALHSSSIYTPEMVVNGKVGFVGSNRARAKNRIRKALQKTAPVKVEIGSVSMTSDHKLQVHYKVSQTSSDAVLHLAVAERGVVRHVKRGENRGLTMHHENVVRSFKTLSLNNSKGVASLQLPDDIDMNKASVMAFVQNNSMKILGAQGKDLKQING